MPSLVAHHHFAAMVEQSAETDIAHASAVSPRAYRWGAQGPDILFYHNAPFGSRTALLGHRMHHESIAETFSAMIKLAAHFKNPSALSYILGFCTHYCLDRRIHPYVQDSIQTLLLPNFEYDTDGCHRLCEAYLDVAVIERYISSEQESFESFRLLNPQPKTAHLIGTLLSHVGEQVYAIPTSPARVEAAMRTMRTVHTLLHAGSETARTQIASLERLFGKPGLLTTMMRPAEPIAIDCANLSHRVWHKASMPEVERTDSFFDLFEGAIPAALALQRAAYNCYYKGTAMSPLFFRLDYNGLPLK